MLDLILKKAQNLKDDVLHVGHFLLSPARFRRVVADPDRGWVKALSPVTAIAIVTYIGLAATAEFASDAETASKEEMLAIFALLGLVALLTTFPLVWVFNRLGGRNLRVQVVAETFLTAWTLFCGLLLIGVVSGLILWTEVFNSGSESEVYELPIIAAVIGSIVFLLAGAIVGWALYKNFRAITNCSAETAIACLALWFLATYGLTAAMPEQVGQFFVAAIRKINASL